MLPTCPEVFIAALTTPAWSPPMSRHVPQAAPSVNMLAAMAAPLLWLGLYPQPLFNAVRPGLAALQQRAVREPTPLPAAVHAPPAAAGTAAARPTAPGATADTADAPTPGGAQ